MPPRRVSRPPFLLPQNRLAWEVFQACMNQVIVAGMTGAVLALNHAVWEFEFEMNDVPRSRRREVYRKLRELEAFWIQKLASKSSEREGKGV